jgi:hypothetical protein
MKIRSVVNRILIESVNRGALFIDTSGKYLESSYYSIGETMHLACLDFIQMLQAKSGGGNEIGSSSIESVIRDLVVGHGLVIVRKIPDVSPDSDLPCLDIQALKIPRLDGTQMRMVEQAFGISGDSVVLFNGSKAFAGVIIYGERLGRTTWNQPVSVPSKPRIMPKERGLRTRHYPKGEWE